MSLFVAGAAFGEVHVSLFMPVARRSVKSVPCSKRIDHEVFSRQARHLVMLAISCLKRIAHEGFFLRQVQHLVLVEVDLCCFAHCK